MHTYAITGAGIVLRFFLECIVWRWSLSRTDALQAKAELKEGGIASARGGLPARGESCSACTGQNQEIAQEGVLHAGKALCLNLTSGFACITLRGVSRIAAAILIPPDTIL